MRISIRLLSHLILSLSLGLFSITVSAKPSTRDSSCLSQPEINSFTRDALTVLQSIDASVSLTDVKLLVNNLGDCITLEAANLAVDEYASGLLGVAVNSAPSILGIPLTSLAEGEQYIFTPIASDPDGDPLIFDITNQPSWASFDSATGALTGTPSYEDANSYRDIVISVSDGTEQVSLVSFSIEVVNTNRPPIISGIPSAVVSVGDYYSFTPDVIDPDGDALSFSIDNLPEWMSFDINTAELFGEPTAADVGDYVNISITASDGVASVSLEMISLSVESIAPVTGSANLTWEIPATRSDGTELLFNDIAGYRVYMGMNYDDLQMLDDLQGGSTTRYTILNLTTGTYYFAVTAYDVDDNESTFSDIVSKEI